MHRLTDGDLTVWKAHFLGQALIGPEPVAVRYSSNWTDFQIWILFLGIPIRFTSKLKVAWIRQVLKTLAQGSSKVGLGPPPSVGLSTPTKFKKKLESIWEKSLERWGSVQGSWKISQLSFRPSTLLDFFSQLITLYFLVFFELWDPRWGVGLSAPLYWASPLLDFLSNTF